MHQTLSIIFLVAMKEVIMRGPQTSRSPLACRAPDLCFENVRSVNQGRDNGVGLATTKTTTT